MKDPLDIILEVARTLEHLGVNYLIGGSVASSIQGFPRITNDVDMVALISARDVSDLYESLKSEFYIDKLSMKRAVRTGSSFNAIHSDSLFKVDFYLASDAFDEEQLKRRQLAALRPNSTEHVYFSTPEDTILAKLAWFREGNEISERQWSDVLGVLKVQGDRLDFEYLRKWAHELGLDDLFKRALGEAKSSFPGKPNPDSD
jgi:hypothetical protein